MFEGLKNLVNAFSKGRFTDNPLDVSGAEKIGRFYNDITGVTSANRFSAEQAELNREFQSAEAAKAYNRELEADSSKYQRTVEDLKQAGINPLMSVNGMSAGSVSATGAAGSSASSVGASGGATIISAVLRGVSQVVSSALKVNSAKTVQELKAMNANEITSAKNDNAFRIQLEKSANNLDVADKYVKTKRNYHYTFNFNEGKKKK